MLEFTDVGSRMTEAVNPAALLPLPEVYTAIGATFSTNLSNCDFAVPGSPNNKTLMSPRRVNSSGRLQKEKGNKCIKWLNLKEKKVEIFVVLDQK